MEALPLGEISATPWSFSPYWFLILVIVVPAAAWLAFAWRRAFEEDPNRVRRSGVKELRRLVANIRKSRASPASIHLHAWMRATARTWGVQASAPTVNEVSTAQHTITGDAALTSSWRDLWHATERGLFAPNAAPPADWLERTSTFAASVEMPQRQTRYPNRLRHWLPSLAATVLTIMIGFASGTARAEAAGEEDPAAAANAAALLEAEGPAEKALQTHWNDWAAHHNIAAARIQQGDWNVAIAHATASFLQHPSSPATRGALRVALQQTPAADPHLQRMLYGTWYERIPGAFSVAGWQGVALASGLLLAGAIIAMILALYVPRRTPKRTYLMLAGRGVFAIGLVVFSAALYSWNAYGAMNQPTAAILVKNANLSPAPTDLVPEEETSPLAAGTVVLTRRSFLGWQQVAVGNETSGWVRDNAVMPFYARRT